MPHINTARRVKTGQGKYNGFGHTTLPVHPKDLEAQEALPAYTPSSELILASRLKDAFPPAYLASATTDKEKEKESEEEQEIEAVRVAQKAIDASVLAEQRLMEAREAYLVCALHASLARMAAADAIKAAEELVVFFGTS